MAEETVTAAPAAEEHQNGAVSFSAMKVQVMVPSQKAEEAVAFYKEAFGAEEVKRSTYPKRKGGDQELLCSEIKIGPSAFLICDQADDSLVGGGLVFRLETNDVEGAITKAVKAGAVQEGETTEDEGICGGGIVGKLKDPFGTAWIVASAGKKCCPETAA